MVHSIPYTVLVHRAITVWFNIPTCCSLLQSCNDFVFACERGVAMEHSCRLLALMLIAVATSFGVSARSHKLVQRDARLAAKHVCKDHWQVTLTLP